MGGTGMWILQDGRYIRRDGENGMIGPLILGNGDPSEANHAARKAYVDRLISGTASAADIAAAILILTQGGGTIDARIAAAVAAYLPLAGGVMTGNLTLGGAPTLALHAATMAYSDLKLPLVGGVMTGAITLPGAPVNALHAATKAYVDALPVAPPTFDAIVAAAGGDYTSLVTACATEAAGARIFVESGTYNEGADVIVKDGQMLIGQNPDDTIVDFGGANFNITNDGGGANRAVENLTVQGSIAAQTIDMAGVHTRVVNNRVIGTVNSFLGIYVTGTNSFVSQNRVEGFTKAGAQYGIYLLGASCLCYFNVIDSCTRGIKMSTTSIVVGNELTTITDVQILTNTYSIVVGNMFYGNADIEVGGHQNTISANQFYGDMVWTSDHDQIAVTGNQFLAGGLVCAQANTHSCAFTGNVFTNAPGIDFWGSDSVISGNSFQGTALLDFAAGSKYNLAIGNNFSSSTIAVGGRILDAGLTGNTAYANQGVPHTSEKLFTSMQNVSGGALADGDVAVFNAVASGNEFTTTVIAGDDKVCGVVNEAINNNAWGMLQFKGKMVTLKVNGTINIAIGDYLGTHTDAGISMKAESGHTTFAIALEAYAADDSNGIIDALLVDPFRMDVSNYAGIMVEGNAVATTVLLVDAYEPITVYDTDMPEVISDGDQANYNVGIGESRDYVVSVHHCAHSAGANKAYYMAVFEIEATGFVVSNATQANPCVITAVGHTFINGDRVKIDGVAGMIQLNGQIYTVAGVAGDNFNLNDDNGANINSGAYGAYGGPGTVVLATILDGSVSHQLFAGIGAIHSLGASGIAALTRDNTLEAHVKGTTDASDITVCTSQIVLQKV